MTVVFVVSIPQMSAPPPPAPLARKKYTLAEVFGEDDDDDDDDAGDNEEAAAAGVGAGKQDFGRPPPPPPVPGKLIPIHNVLCDNCRAVTNLENLEKSEYLIVVRENVFCLLCVTSIAMVTEYA